MSSSTLPPLAVFLCVAVLTESCTEEPVGQAPEAPQLNTPKTDAEPPERRSQDAEPTEGVEDLEEWSVERAQAAMTRGELTAVELTTRYLARIDRVDPRLNAIIATVPDALEQAKRLDGERAAGRIRSPLHGIPVAVKDNIAVRGIPNTAGSLALIEIDATQDAPVIRSLREAGAVIVAKANLSEWANFRGRRSSSGWSAVGGQVRNPHVLDRSPCGSSSGSAVSVAANLSVLALGTETDGSIVCPASANGIVGLKPTVGSLSGDGVIPISPTQDTVGPMGRSVADVAAMFTALSGSDRSLEPTSLKGVRVGVARNLVKISAEVERVFEAAADVLEQAGVELVDVELREPNGQSELEVLIREMGPAMASYLEAYTPDRAPKTLAELARFNREQADRELRWFGQEWFEMAVEAKPLDDAKFVKLRRDYRRDARAAIDDLLKDQKLVALIAPTTSPAWPIDLINGDHVLGGTSSTSAAAGYPIVSLPMGSVESLPVGMSLIGSKDSEWDLLGLAIAFESAFAPRKTPAFLETLALPGSATTPPE